MMLLELQPIDAAIAALADHNEFGKGIKHVAEVVAGTLKSLMTLTFDKRVISGTMGLLSLGLDRYTRLHNMEQSKRFTLARKVPMIVSKLMTLPLTETVNFEDIKVLMVNLYEAIFQDTAISKGVTPAATASMEVRWEDVGALALAITETILQLTSSKYLVKYIADRILEKNKCLILTKVEIKGIENACQEALGALAGGSVAADKMKVKVKDLDDEEVFIPLALAQRYVDSFRVAKALWNERHFTLGEKVSLSGMLRRNHRSS